MVRINGKHSIFYLKSATNWDWQWRAILKNNSFPISCRPIVFPFLFFGKLFSNTFKGTSTLLLLCTQGYYFWKTLKKVFLLKTLENTILYFCFWTGTGKKKKILKKNDLKKIKKIYIFFFKKIGKKYVFFHLYFLKLGYYEWLFFSFGGGGGVGRRIGWVGLLG